MDLSACSAVYVDERIRAPQWIEKDCSDSRSRSRYASNDPKVQDLIDVFSQTFKRLYICNSSDRFLEVVNQLNAENDFHDRDDDDGNNCGSGSGIGFPGELVPEQCPPPSSPSLLPVFGFIDIPNEPCQVPPSTPSSTSPSSSPTAVSPLSKYLRPETSSSSRMNHDDVDSDLPLVKNGREPSYGLKLVNTFSTDLQCVDEPKNHLLIPVAVLRQPHDLDSDQQQQQQQDNFPTIDNTMTKATILTDVTAPSGPSTPSTSVTGLSTFEATLLDKPLSIEEHHSRQCLDAGAVEVLSGPLSTDSLRPLRTCAYRAQKTAARERSRFMSIRHKPRKSSWMGVDADDAQVPYAYLRESM